MLEDENRQKIIAVDFDGTLCTDKYPEIGEPNYNMIEYIQEEQKNNNAIIILWTCRTYEKDIEEARFWCEEHGIKIDYINRNTPQQIARFGGIDSRKIFADEYLDDRNKTYTNDISIWIDEGDYAEFGVHLMGKFLIYKTYIGTIDYSIEDSLYCGEITDKNGHDFKDLVTYESGTIKGLKQDFAEAVDDYIDSCKEMGKEI